MRAAIPVCGVVIAPQSGHHRESSELQSGHGANRAIVSDVNVPGPVCTAGGLLVIIPTSQQVLHFGSGAIVLQYLIS